MKIEISDSLPTSYVTEKDVINVENPVYTEMHAFYNEDKDVMFVSEKLMKNNNDWLENPTCRGWWYFRSKDERIYSAFYWVSLFKDEPERFVVLVNNRPTELREFNGEWKKVEIPE